MCKSIVVSVDEYRELISSSIKIELFADFVNNSKRSISREDCGRYLGFDLEEKKVQPGSD